MSEWTRKMPWRQGSVIALADLQSLGLELPVACEGGLIITHDCDLANATDVEPSIEFQPFEVFALTDQRKTGEFKFEYLSHRIHPNGDVIA